MPTLPTEKDPLRASSAILTLAEDAAGIGAWDVDLTTGLARATPQFFRLMELEGAGGSVPLERMRARCHPEDSQRIAAALQAAIASGSDVCEIEYRIVRADATVRWIFSRGRVTRDAGGRPIRYSGADFDITGRKQAAAELAAASYNAEAARRNDLEARLRQAQKMEAVGQLTGGLAHDFNNILQVIMGNLELLRRALARPEGKAPPAGQAREWSAPIENALRAARNAAQLTHRLLAFSRLQPLEPTVLEVNELIADMSHLIRHTLGETIEVSTTLRPQLWPAYTDRNQLQSAFLNLVVNARDAMPKGGRLVIETDNIEFREPYPGPLEDIAPGQYVVLSVNDTGCGIPADVLHKVFEPFFTTKDAGKGSGLGLSMVYGFVKQSGGHVRIYSEVGRGTSIRMYLPRSQGAAGHAAAASASADSMPRARAGETVMLVEDDRDVRRYVAQALEGLGYQLIQAPDARTALKLLDSEAAKRVDLLFTDVVLPGGMTGRALADAARARRPGLPVLLTSGYTRDAVLHHGRLDSDVQLLSKPHDLDALAVHVRAAIDRTFLQSR